MATLREAKAIGAAASVLLLIGSGTNVLNLIALLIGIIMLLVATKYISELTSDSVFTNMVYATTFVIIGLIVGFVIVFANFRPILNLSAAPLENLGAFYLAVLPGLVVVWIFFITAGFFARRSNDLIAQSLDADLFRLAATLFLAGAVLIISLGLGFILIFAAIAVQLAAFLSLPDEKRPRQPIDPWGKPLPPASTSQLAKKT